MKKKSMRSHKGIAANKKRLSEIDSSDRPELNEQFWKNAEVRYTGVSKERLTVRFDEDVVRWFRSQGKGYQTKMNAVLRSFYEAHK